MIWELSTNQLVILFSLVASGSFICGWLSDRILGYSGFGIFGNWFIMMTGSTAGLYAVNLLGHRVSREPGLALAATLACALILLISLLTVKKVMAIR